MFSTSNIKPIRGYKNVEITNVEILKLSKQNMYYNIMVCITIEQTSAIEIKLSTLQLITNK